MAPEAIFQLRLRIEKRKCDYRSGFMLQRRLYMPGGGTVTTFAPVPVRRRLCRYRFEVRILEELVPLRRVALPAYLAAHKTGSGRLRSLRGRCDDEQDKGEEITTA